MKFIKKLRSQWHFVIAIILIAIGIILNSYAISKFIGQGFISSFQTSSPTISQKSQTTPSTVSPQVTSGNQQLKAGTSSQPKLGHFPYPEGDVGKMMIVSSYAQKEYQRFERLAPEAALALMKLIYAARDEGVWIIPVSCFRGITDQEKLFKAQIQRRGSTEAAAKISAPPGYSEHHTGYAVDLADGHLPKKDITYDFAKTNAFQWLKLHAKDFGFEMSFPENNPQGVSYEPWHWRYVGSPEASAIFRSARSSR
jgi:D-alanyl-D-alanine carboxypeptidase